MLLGHRGQVVIERAAGNGPAQGIPRFRQAAVGLEGEPEAQPPAAFAGGQTGCPLVVGDGLALGAEP